jgi:hypothetical protein
MRIKPIAFEFNYPINGADVLALHRKVRKEITSPSGRSKNRKIKTQGKSKETKS